MLTKREWTRMKRLRSKYWTVTDIARELGRARGTVQKWLASGEPPHFKPRRPKPSLLDPYADRLRSRLREAPRIPAARLLEEARAMGFPGGYSAVKRFVQAVRGRRRRGRRA